MYQLTSEVYLDKYNKCYKKIIVITPQPQEPELKKITRLVNRDKLSPFQERSPCCPIDQCYYAVLNPNNLCELLCLNELPILFNYLVTNNFKIDYKMTKMLQGSDVKIRNLICYFYK
jgi:hypothetical protein|tara:strand:+ start:587 stop:937 length:351 start_codon:yes stop_codon:yes gene_type:complete